MFPDLEFIKTILNGLRSRIEKVENWAVSEDQATQAVADYLAENPIIESDPTVPEWAKKPEKPTYTASEIGAQPDMFVANFNALIGQLGKKTVVYVAEAGNSSTSPIPSDRYPVLFMRSGISMGQASIVAYDAAGKTWVGAVNFAQGTIELVERTLNALTFTGAVTGSYDGSAPVSVEIPSGGGSGSAENWRLVNTVTTAEDVSDITITQDSDGNPLSMKKVKIFVKVRGNSASLSTWCRITVNNLNTNFYSEIQNTFAATEGQDYYHYARADFAVYAGRLMLELLLRSLNNAASKNTLYYAANSGCWENYPVVVDAITSIRVWSASAGIGSGTELMIYGVDA